jgi:IS4 transposase
MPSAPTVFSQITAPLFQAEFARCTERFPMPRSSRSFSAFDHFLALCFGQLTYRESLRDVITCLSARPNLQFHLGFRGRLTRTNFAYANAHRDWRVFAAVAAVLMRKAARLYAQGQSQGKRPEIVFAPDASIIDLSLKLFPWAFYARSRGSAVKLHALLSLRGNFPAWAAVTEANFPDMKMLDQIPLAAGAFYVLDRAYLDFTRLIRLEQAGAFFVIRNKRHVRFRVTQSRPVAKATGLRCDQTIVLTTPWSRSVYRQPLRRVHFRDAERQRSLIFLTNNFQLEPEVICDLYQRRWQVELFFKWIKQHLRLRNFYGRSENAIRCQIWAAIGAYLLVAIARKEHGLEQSLYQVLQIVSVSALEQVTLTELFVRTTPPPPDLQQCFELSSN